MNTFIFVFIFLLGNIIGSFLNVVIYRFNTGRSIGGRSSCMTCSNTLRWYEMIPVISFLFQKGRCGTCSTKISHQYPLVEFITGIVFAVLAFHFIPVLDFSISNFVFLLTFFIFIFSLLIVITVYDIRHKIIPNTLVYAFIFVSLISVFINTTGIGPLFIIPKLSVFSVGPLLAIPFALISFLSKEVLMGFGDAKLILGIGWLLGLSQGVAALILSFWIGAVFGLLLVLFSKKKTGMKTEVPFAPFIILGTFLVFVFHINVFNLASLFVF